MTQTTQSTTDNVTTIRRYFAAIEQRAPFDELETFFAPDVTADEFPNRLVANGKQRDLAALRDASERGRKAVTAQHYEVVTALGDGALVCAEVIWTGTLAVPVGTIPAGGTMRCRSAMFFELRDGRIVRQRNYDCFDPW